MKKKTVKKKATAKKAVKKTAIADVCAYCGRSIRGGGIVGKSGKRYCSLACKNNARD